MLHGGGPTDVDDVHTPACDQKPEVDDDDEICSLCNTISHVLYKVIGI